MILIIGGACQGKTAYAKGHFGEGYRFVNHYHQTVREQMLAGLDPMEKARELVESENGTEDGKVRPDGEKNPEGLVIISDEIGYGLVPLDAFEREYREMDGRVHCYLASRAEQVIRVVCGIGVRIK